MANGKIKKSELRKLVNEVLVQEAEVGDAFSGDDKKMREQIVHFLRLNDIDKGGNKVGMSQESLARKVATMVATILITISESNMTTAEFSKCISVLKIANDRLTNSFEVKDKM